MVIAEPCDRVFGRLMSSLTSDLQNMMEAVSKRDQAQLELVLRKNEDFRQQFKENDKKVSVLGDRVVSDLDALRQWAKECSCPCK